MLGLKRLIKCLALWLFGYATEPPPPSFEPSWSALPATLSHMGPLVVYHTAEPRPRANAPEDGEEPSSSPQPDGRGVPRLPLRLSRAGGGGDGGGDDNGGDDGGGDGGDGGGDDVPGGTDGGGKFGGGADGGGLGGGGDGGGGDGGGGAGTAGCIFWAQSAVHRHHSAAPPELRD